MADSNAQRFFDRFLAASDKVTFIKSLINPDGPAFETEWLDFKSGQSLDKLGNPKPIKEFLDEAKKTWSENLSAFANASGGVLIFGVIAKKKLSPLDPTVNIDAASDLMPVTNPAALHTRLMELHDSATEPPIGGIQVEHVDDPPNGGYVVCYVPEGTVKPYRALHKTNEPYMLRLGDDNRVMPHPIVRNLFYPQSTMHLKIKVESFKNRADNTTMLEIHLTNTGGRSVSDCFVTLDECLVYDSTLFQPPHRTDVSRYHCIDSKQYFDFDKPLQPGRTYLLLRANYAKPKHGFQDFVEFNFKFYGRDCDPQKAQIIIHGRYFEYGTTAEAVSRIIENEK